MKNILLGAAGFLSVALCVLWLIAPATLLDDIPFGSIILDAKGGALRIGLSKDDKYRLRAQLQNISPEAIKATLEYEDRYFFRHPGVNPIALLRGAFSLVSGRRKGGSTITMQVARLRGKLQTSTIRGKMRQIIMALALELRHSKQDILEAYFNLAPYGGNVEGIEAAARIYFHKSALQLTAQESRALAIVPQNPVARRPGSGDFHAARMRIYGDAAPLRIYGQQEIPFIAPHLALELGNNGGTIRTSIEPDLQRMLERRLRAFIDRHQRHGIVNGSALLARSSDMAVLALVGSANYFSAPIGGQIDGTRARRSPGSTLKPFIYAKSLDQGIIHPMTILADSPKSFGGYDPENFDRDFQGPISATAALQTSRNLPAIVLAEQLAPPGLYGFLREAQVALEHGADHYGLALVLGGAEVTMRELATLYGCLVNRGLWRPLRFVKGASAEPPKRLLSPEAAWLTMEMLRRDGANVASGGFPIPYFYKTGTSNGLRDAWTAGIIGDYILIIWLGNFDNSANSMLVGATVALLLFEEMAQSLGAMRRLEAPGKIPPPNLNITSAQICAATGDIYKGQCAEPETSWIIPGVSPIKDTGIYRKILVDRDTGLRSCDGKNAEHVWHEVWPSDMRAIFAAAGIYKPELPEWSSDCSHMAPPGVAPRILLPKRNVIYGHRYKSGVFSVLLQGAADGETKMLHWYAGKNYIGSVKPGETLLWHPHAGMWELVVVDDAGRSARQICQIINIAE